MEVPDELWCGHDAAIIASPPFLLRPFPEPHFLCCDSSGEKEAAGEAGKSQYGDVARLTASAADWSRDGGQNSANAQVVRRIQERRRFAGDPRNRREAARKNAQVFDRWEAGCGKADDAIGEVHSSC